MINRRKFITNSLLGTAGIIFASDFLTSCQSSTTTKVDADLLQLARDIHFRALTIDSHCDTPMNLLDPTFDISIRNTNSKIGSKVDFPRMKEGGLDASFFAVFTGQGKRNPEAYQKVYDKAIKIFDAIHNCIKNNSQVAELALLAGDAERIARTGKRAIYIGVENGYPIGLDLNNIKKFHELGARYITLCHSTNNDICDSSTDKAGAEHNGLSEFGKKVVAEMNRLGIMVDISHASEKSFFDVCNLSTKPVIASHSCARAICDHPRNLTDEMLLRLKNNGGVIQLCILSEYVQKAEPNPVRESAFAKLREKYNNFDDLTDEQQKLAWQEWEQIEQTYPVKLTNVLKAIDHIDHIVKVAGIDHVGIGTDFDGGGGLADCQDVSQLPNITIELVKRGYNEQDIRKIWGGNLLRVFREVQNVNS